MTDQAAPEVVASRTREVFLPFAIMMLVYISIEAACARWSPRGSLFFYGGVHLITWLSCSVWGASIVRRAFSAAWRPVAGVLAFLLLLVSLLLVAVGLGCLLSGRGCYY